MTAGSAVLVETSPGQPSAAELERRAQAGEGHRKDYVEIARALGAVVVDDAFMTRDASPAARLLFARVDRDLGQVAEAFIHRRRLRTVLVYGDRRGLPLALLHKLTRSRPSVTLSSMWVRQGGKANFLKHLKVHTHLHALLFTNPTEAAFVVTQLGVPPEKVHVVPGAAVDDRFWRPVDPQPDEVVCGVGWSGRDWPTFMRAIAGIDVPAEVDMGGYTDPTESQASVDAKIHALVGQEPPSNFTLVRCPTTVDLRRLYARSRFVVVPVKEGYLGAGLTTIVEALAMGKAVITTRTTSALTDLIRDGEHALYVPPDDPAALREAIARLYAQPDEAERMGKAGRALVERELTLDAHVRQVLAVIGAP